MEKKRYNLVIAQPLFDEVQKLADAHAMNVAEVLRRFIKLGLTLADVEENSPNAIILIREDDVETRLVGIL